MKLSKGLDIANIEFSPRKRVQSIEGVLSLLSTSKEFYIPLLERKKEGKVKKPLIFQKKISKTKEKNKTKISLHRAEMNKLQKTNEKTKQKLEKMKKIIMKDISEYNPQTGDTKEEKMKKEEGVTKKTKVEKILKKRSRISKKLRRINQQS